MADNGLSLGTHEVSVNKKIRWRGYTNWTSLYWVGARQKPDISETIKDRELAFQV